MPNTSIPSTFNQIPKPFKTAGKDIASFVTVQLEFLEGLLENQQELYGDSPQDLTNLKNSFADIEQGIISSAKDFGNRLEQTSATEAERADIGALGDSAVKALSADIDQFVEQGIRNAVQTVAPSRGLRGGDTPILQFLSQSTLEPANKAFTAGAASIRANQANQLLNFPLQRSSQDLQAAQFQQGALQNRQAINNSMATLFQSGQQQGLNLGSLAGAQSSQIAPIVNSFTPTFSKFVDQDVGRGGFFGSPGGQVAGQFIANGGPGQTAEGVGALAPFFA